MKLLNASVVTKYVETHIGDFHQRRLQNLESLKLETILKRKNPYLFKAKNILTAEEFVQLLLSAHLSSQEESIFGEFLEGLAIFISDKVYGGRKSSAQGIDLELEKSGIHYVVSIKSGPSWGNSRQISKMKDDFKAAKRILGTSGGIREIVAINGCCYGSDKKPNKGDYYKLCGQEFWDFISGNENLYVEIIEPLGHRAKQHNDDFIQAYARIINNFTLKFINEYCVDGVINWQKIVVLNSGKSIPKIKKRKQA